MTPKAYRRGSNGTTNETTSQQISRLERELEQCRDEVKRVNDFREGLRYKFNLIRDDRDMLTAGLVEAVKALEDLDKEVRDMAVGLVRPTLCFPPTSDTLHWEGVSPSELEPCEEDKILSRGWLKLLSRTSEKVLATLTPLLKEGGK